MSYFALPEGYTLPDGIKEGDEFNEIASFKIEDGKVKVLTLGEKKFPVVSDKKASKPQSAKDMMKEQLTSLEDKKGNAKMEDTEK